MERRRRVTNNKKNKEKFDRSSVTADQLDYKNPKLLRHFLGGRSQIIPRRYSKLSSKLHRKLANEIKKARQMGLLKYTERH